MIDGALIFIGGMIFGGAFWVPLAFNKFIRAERATVTFEVNPETLKQLNGALVAAWLDANGLTWMPKGVDFKAKVTP